MLHRKRSWGRGWVLVAGLAALLVAALSLGSAYADECCGGYSGDDAYDPAAGGNPEASVPAASGRSMSARSTFSGDDLYDPAAGGRPEQWLIALSARSNVSADSTFSGDDAYDPAAGGLAARSLAPSTVSDELVAYCDLGEEELARRDALRVPGGVSGDAAYDPAAGGTPELALVPFAAEGQLAALCEAQAGSQ